VVTHDEPEFGELASSFAAIAQTLFIGRTVDATLRRIVDFAQATVGACDSASISLLNNGKTFTPVSSSPIANDIDQYQYEFGEGPCLDAINSETLLYSDDLTDDLRWPKFGPKAVSLGMRSLLSCRLTSTTTLGSLNLYARVPQAYDSNDRTVALIFATHAGVALGAAGALDAEIRKSHNLEGALASRAVIGQAQGILIERERLTPDQAFKSLTKASQHLNLKLRDIAQYVVDTGEVPEP
jgi:hypothetical protein